MMYVAVYPIALSVRSTNVYEERSLGLFNEDDELVMNDEDKGAQAVARYVGWQYVSQRLIRAARLIKVRGDNWLSIFGGSVSLFG